MRFLTRFCATLALTLPFLASPALAQDNSALLRVEGLAGAIETLEAKPNPTRADLFTLGGAHFLRSVERALQTRYRHGMTGQTLELPILRLQVPPNPDPEPFRPELVRQIFSDLQADLALSRAALDRIGPEPFGAEIALADLWFDVNDNGLQDSGETVFEQFAGTLMPRFRATGMATQGNSLPVVRFDSADVPWLQAYTHFLSGISDLIIAFDPTDAIAQIADESARLDTLMAMGSPVNAFDSMFADDVDAIVMLYRALEQRPDTARLAGARSNFLTMIALNQDVWARVETETDDDREWIPSARQSSALGLTLPPETGTVWLDVLSDARALLEGDKLIPHWRMGSATGINLARMLEDGPAVDLVGWFHGGALLPYAEQGERISAVNLRQFERMMRGDALLFAIFLN